MKSVSRHVTGAKDAVPVAEPSVPAPRVSSRWAALAFIAAAQLMIALDATIVNIALPSAQTALHFSTANRQWVVTAYTLAFAGLVLLGGRIADYAGRKRAFLIGLAGFAVTSAIGGAATNIGMLAGARAAQGAFAALLAPTTLSLLAVTFTGNRERAKAFAIYGAIAGSGAAVGLVLGGMLAEYVSWRWCLYVNVPVAAIAAAGAWITLPADGAGRRQRLDVPGALLASGALVAFVYACTDAVAAGWASVRVSGLLGVAAVLLAIFVVVESRVAAPLLPLRIVRERSRAGAQLSVGLSLAGLLGVYLFLTYYLQAVEHYSPVRAGLAFLPLTAAVQVSAMVIASRLVTRVAPRALIVPGLAVAAVAMLLLTQLRAGSGYVTHLLPAELLLGAGLGIVFVPAFNTASRGVDPRDAGVAAAVVNTAQQAGGSIGTALLNTIAASATIGYFASHRAGTGAGAAASQRAAVAAASAATVHGYAVAAAWAAALVAVAALLAAVMINARAPEATRDSTREEDGTRKEDSTR